MRFQFHLYALFIVILLGFQGMGARIAFAADEWKSSIGAELGIGGLYYLQEQAPDHKTPQGIISAKIPASLRYGRTWRLRLLATGTANPQNISKEERVYGDFPEAYMQWQNLPFTLQLGFNTVTWGVTDGYNPLDIVNPRRYFDPLRSEKLGSFMFLAKRDFDGGLVEALYIPKQREAILPGENSRWLPREVFVSPSVGTGFGSARVVLPTTLRYHYLSSLELNNALDNNFGLRIKKQFSGLDLSAVAFEGAANTPAVNLARITANATSLFPTLTFVVDPDVYLQAAYYKTRVYGASAVLAAGDFLLKAESAYTKPISVRNDLPERVIESVFGIERTMALGAGSLTTLLQGSYGDRKEAANTSSTSLARIFDRGAMIALRYMPSEKLTWLSSFLRDTKYKGNFIHSDINYALSDTVKISAGAEFLKGDAETPLGTYEKNDRVMLGFNCHW